MVIAAYVALAAAVYLAGCYAMGLYLAARLATAAHPGVATRSGVAPGPRLVGHTAEVDRHTDAQPGPLVRAMLDTLPIAASRPQPDAEARPAATNDADEDRPGLRIAA